MTAALVIVGAGGFGREVVDIIEAINHHANSPQFDLLGVIDSSPAQLNLDRLAARNIPYLGTEAEWLARSPEQVEYLVGIGSTKVRELVVSRFAAAGLQAATAVHPSALFGSECTVGAGSIICAGVQATTNITIGRHVQVNINATLGHDSDIEDFVSINPLAAISGDVRLARGSYIGAGAVVLQGLTVGAHSTVGASACVVKDVPDGEVVKGVPAR